MSKNKAYGELELVFPTEAYKVANDLIDKIKGKEKEVKEFTDKYLKEILKL